MRNRYWTITIACSVAIFLHCGINAFNHQATKEYDTLILSPMEAYNDAVRCYLSKNYPDAAWKFGLVLYWYPNWFLNGKSIYYLGNSLFLLGQTLSADSVFSLGINPGDTTIYYKNILGKVKCAFVLKQWNRLVDYVSDSTIKHVGGYVGDSLGKKKVRLYNAIGRALVRSPGFEDSIFTLVEKLSSDEELVQAIESMHTKIAHSSSEDQASLLFYLLQYPLPDQFIQEKRNLLSRINFKPLQTIHLKNLESRKTDDELIQIIESNK